MVGLGLGDEGKGAVVDHLVREREAHTVMRFSGGSQAAHNVVAPDGRHHTFAQFGSGTLAGANTYLGPRMMINPLDMFNEFYHLASIGEADAWDRLTVNDFCLVTTPVHQAANVVREHYRGARAHGTTGKGIGETRRMDLEFGNGLRAGDLSSKDETRKRIGELIDYYTSVIGSWRQPRFEEDGSIQDAEELLTGLRPELVEEMVDRYSEWASRTRLVHGFSYLQEEVAKGTVVLEGSQGILLDEKHGFHPHTTWADLSARTARRELGAAGLDDDAVCVVGVTRAYSTRHGAGPFPAGKTEKDHPSWFRRNVPFVPELHNDGVGAAGAFLTGWFDAVMFDYACTVVEPSVLAVTHLDVQLGRDPDIWPVVRSYEYGGDADLERYFVLDGEQRIVGIYGGDTAHMECVTRRLFDCRPVVDIDVDVLSILDEISSLAGGVPVAIVGEGPDRYRTLERAVAG